jgi:flagellar hook assembly protein FlgD
MKRLLLLSILLPAPCAAAFLEAPAALLADNFTVTRIAPRIFSPGEASADVNRVRFYFENPDNSEVCIRIFDCTGALVKRNLERESENVMFWDGSDTNDAAVKGGIYIYQIEAGKKIINGTIVVAQ